MESFGWLRYISAAAGAISFAVLTANHVARRHKMRRRTRRLSAWFLAIVGGVAYASGRAAQRDLPVTEVTFYFCITMLGLFFAIIWRPNGDDETLPHDGSLTERFREMWKQKHPQ